MSKEKCCTLKRLEEKGWEAKRLILLPLPFGAPVAVGGPDRRYLIGLSCLATSGDFVLMDNVRNVLCVARVLPTEERAARLLARYGVPTAELEMSGPLPRVPTSEEE